MRHHFPFMPKIRTKGEEIYSELKENIEKTAEMQNLDITKLSAVFELRPVPGNEDPKSPEYYLISEVVYEDKKPTTCREAGRKGGKGSVNKRFKGMTKKQISEYMKKVRRAGIKQKD